MLILKILPSVDFKKAYPEKFIKCFIAEQNMIRIAVGISTRGYCPFLATFVAILTRDMTSLEWQQYHKLTSRLLVRIAEFVWSR